MMDVASPPDRRPAHIAVLGAGLAGLFCALSLSERGVRVTLVDRGQPGSGASQAAAGMLAPAFEAAGDASAHPALFDLCVAGAELWQSVAPRLSAEAGTDVGYQPGPSLAVASDVSQLHRIEVLRRGLIARSVPFEPLDAEGLKWHAPMLRASLPAGLVLPSDGQVDNRALVAALVKVLVQRRVEMQAGMVVTRLEADEDGITLNDALRADAVIDARGWQVPGMQPVKGTALSLRPHAGLPDRVVRFGGAYLVPKAGRVVLGASVEAGRSDAVIEESVVGQLLNQAERVCPAVRDTQILERWSGIRPKTADLGPVTGWIGQRHYVVGGHYRNGVLLAPLTGEIAASHILTGERSPLAAAFDPARPALRRSAAGRTQRQGAISA